MMNTKNFLFELGTEELPAKALKKAADDLVTLFTKELQAKNLFFKSIKSFATPRRLAILISDLITQQDDQLIEKKGPAIANAFDPSGNPTQATQGFARSCNVDVKDLEQSNGFLFYKFKKSGEKTKDLLGKICESIITKLAMTKPMRFGDNYLFIRPAQWLLILFGKEVIPAKIFGKTSSNLTYGHRFLSQGSLTINDSLEYEKILEKHFVIADFAKRKTIIENEIKKIAENEKAEVVLDPNLLDEVTGIVEWPVAILAHFKEKFLKVPKEALISAMQTHQKSFALIDEKQNLKANFITISNIISRDPQKVKFGNECVMDARLSDADFFFHSDCKMKLSDRNEVLKQTTYLPKLGTLQQKSLRIAELAKKIAHEKEKAERAGLLCKSDLVSDMVKEFPELQGIMGYYYALNDKESEDVAIAIRDHYCPKFSGDQLPENSIGDAIALADRLDTLVCVFGINQIPTGDKDPYALRRAALGILRILIEKKYSFDLLKMIEEAIKNCEKEAIQLPNQDTKTQVFHFILERLRALYLDQEISADTLNAVLDDKENCAIPYDVHLRIMAVHEFRKLPEAKSLSAANKRASNILSKSVSDQKTLEKLEWQNINVALFSHDAEQSLYNALAKFMNRQEINNYQHLLNELASLRDPIDMFFDNVMVMSDDEKIRNNRLSLLVALRKIFLQIADISKLQE